MERFDEHTLMVHHPYDNLEVYQITLGARYYGLYALEKSEIVYFIMKNHWNIEKEELDNLINKNNEIGTKIYGTKEEMTFLKEQIEALVMMKKLV